MPLAIEFRTKVQGFQDENGAQVGCIVVPKLTRSHIPDLAAWRQSRAFGGFANSDMFPAILKGAATRAGLEPGRVIRLDRWPEGVALDRSGFLAKVTIPVEDRR